MAKHLREFLKPAADKPRRNASEMAVLKDKNQQLIRTNRDLAKEITLLKQSSLFDLKREKRRRHRGCDRQHCFRAKVQGPHRRMTAWCRTKHRPAG